MEGRGLDSSRLEATENLLRLTLDLLFLARDERQNVVRDVERGDAGIARARKRLQGRRHDGLDTEARMQRREREREHDGRAVRVRHYHAARESARRLLRVEQCEVFMVDFRYEERHILVHP